MESKRLSYIFVAGGIGLTLYLSYLILKPFLTPILLGIIFAIVFYPLYLKLLEFTKGRKAVASLSVCLLVTIIIVIPLALLTEHIVGEMLYIYEQIDKAGQTGSYKELFPFLENQTLQNLYQKLSRHFEVFQLDIKGFLLNILKESSSYIVGVMTHTVKNLTIFIINLLLMVFTMYYLFKDSDTIASEIRELVPLSEDQKERIFARLKDIIYATIYGTLAAGALQGLLGGLAFWVLGLSSPVLWGVVMGLLAIFPMFGAFFIWLPASLILFIQGSYVSAIILLVWGTLVISMVDNLIWPWLVSGRAMLHPLAAFFGFLGGIIVFGPIGLFVGPFVMAIFLVLMEIIKEPGKTEESI